ncbi:hypothetical protein L1987_45729 [Smallanthus sonchifolius]|uniref:Uncharacterized protein n=1 Tax=Smallanthus sonchifolius TaxID=185202 RepID=A0ACB9FXW1_9ASTR|nr:hypothetical protein L1987_45729 [Smallanthus sonchifolius]
MSSTPAKEVLEPSLEPERDLHQRLHACSRFVAQALELDKVFVREVVADEVDEMADIEEGRMLLDFGKPTLGGLESSINRPTVEAHQFEIKSSIIQKVQNMWQFDSKDHKDPNTHTTGFLEICATFKIRDASDYAVWLRLFPFSLRDRAKAWLLSFPPAKLKARILSFQQDDGETIFEAWERFKELRRKVPHHGLLRWKQCVTFYNFLYSLGRQLIDAYAGGDIGTKTPQQAYEILEQRVHHVDGFTSLAAQVKEISTKIEQMQVHKAPTLRELFGGAHPTSACQIGDQGTHEQVDFMSNQNHPHNNPYSNTYNPRWRNHHNFSRKSGNNSQQPPGFTQRPPFQHQSLQFQGQSSYSRPQQNQFQG